MDREFYHREHREHRGRKREEMRMKDGALYVEGGWADGVVGRGTAKAVTPTGRIFGTAGVVGG